MLANFEKKIEETIEKIPDKNYEIGLILGSGFGVLADEIAYADVISYKDIPYFPQSTVPGHEGKLVLGSLHGKNIFCMQGRFHYYEGYSLTEITYPVRIMQKLGIPKLIVTNAAGGLNLDFSPGDLMIIIDHINLLGENPLRGRNLDNFGERFPDMSEAYNVHLRQLAREKGSELGLNLQEGVYAAVQGPNYETPSEVRFLKKIGVDAVGMSTVPEVIVANHGNMDVLGISCITNMAAGVFHKKLSHSEVIETTEKVKMDFIRLLSNIIRDIE